ncbi:pentapeptide repeat-containing protein [Veronia pacifica]|uniref:pentapeptide repeat-containing protein n=1 Tax=Veronia pacifica TaxID=1080227 RepID=UPI003628CC06
MSEINNNESYVDALFHKLSSSYEEFVDVEFEECHFTDCDFSSAIFQRCKFTNCVFERCNLSLTDLSASKLFGIRFLDTKLVGVDWTKATWPVYHLDFELTFERCILNDSSFFGLTLNELAIDECKLHDVDFREGNFVRSKMVASDFSYSLFMRTNLQDVDFTDSTAYAIDILENQIKGATFSRYEALNLLNSLDIELVD